MQGARHAEDAMRFIQMLASLIVLIAFSGWPAAAQGKKLVVIADSDLEASGLLGYLLPRFKLKHGIAIDLITQKADALPVIQNGGDLLIAPVTIADALMKKGRGHSYNPAFHVEGTEDRGYATLILTSAEYTENAKKFVSWLSSKVGQNTILAFIPDNHPAYIPGVAQQRKKIVSATPTGDASAGEKLALLHCGRCHVISEKNRFGGIGSTPSFAALRSIPDWKEKFGAFFSANPHPSFTQIIDVTPSFDPARPPHIAPVVLTIQELEAIVAFATGIPPKDLGAGIQAR